MTTSPQGTEQPTPADAAQPMLPHNRCSLRGLNGTRTPIDEPHSFSSRKGANTIYVRTCDLCGAIDWDDVHEETVKRVVIETTRLRAEVERRERQIGLHLKLANEEAKRADALAAKLAAVKLVADQPDRNWQQFDERLPNYFIVDAGERARRTGWRQGVSLFRDQLRAALGEDGGTER